MIVIRKNPFGDTRTCDVDKIEVDQFIEANHWHISDVVEGLNFFQGLLIQAAYKHDWDKIQSPEANQFFLDFKNRFAEGHTSWWDNHRKIHRHHLNYEDGVPEDVNLIDVIEYITDCVMAGLARSGSVYTIEASDELLRKAFNNTIEKLKKEVIVTP